MDETMTPVLRRGKKDRTLIACATTGTMITLILLIGLVLISTVIAYKNDNPGAWVTPCAYLSAMLAAFGGGFTGARLRGRQGLFCGLLTGVGVLLIFTVGLLIFTGESELQVGKILLFYTLMYIVTVMGSMAGGIRLARPRRRGRH